jgi:hypothetical protein
MKYRILSFILLFSIKIKCQPLDTLQSEIEKKYQFIEVWGLKNQTKKYFSEKIIKCPGGICESSLKLMGFIDGNKIPLAF